MWPKWFQGIGSRLWSPHPDRVWAWLPSRCAVCQSWPHSPLCDTCISRFAQPQHRCPTCALPLPHPARRCGACLKTPPPLDLCVTATAYAWPWVGLIARYKFQQQPGWAGPLATLMASAPWAEDTLDAADWVLPIPLSAQRLAERGYNQSWLLARRLSPSKADAHLLLRTRDTPSQRTLPRTERLANLVGAFAVEPLRAAQLRGKKVVLVDDVMTSGASLHTAARVLREAGAAQVSALVLARTEAGSDA
ncbi:phosphoribosyltransferase [Limnohabitans sp. 2KL-1]|uniref:ComF family protein n=1 Tax=Limnohabitans sp. 2KL-1 TaxID=1100699 RepID=UPI000D39FBBD|nr:ComF family protein [Limnohabitans sp. 2KL-1]PUE48209.1 phosphoribosyltransferase [Limnohabitans sp. 2KL-1]